MLAFGSYLMSRGRSLQEIQKGGRKSVGPYRVQILTNQPNMAVVIRSHRIFQSAIICSRVGRSAYLYLVMIGAISIFILGDNILKDSKANAFACLGEKQQ